MKTIYSYSINLLLLLVVANYSFPESKTNTQRGSFTDSVTSKRSTLKNSSSISNLPDSKENNILFAFADESGKFLLVNTVDSLPKGPYFGVTTNGRTFNISFVGKRATNKASNGLQTIWNFQNLGGYLFKVEQQLLSPNDNYLIVTHDYLKAHRPIGITKKNSYPNDAQLSKRISNLKGYTIKSIWPCATTSDLDYFIIILFNQERDTALASLVLIKDSSLVFEDYAGNPKRDGSVWRVDDGGIFDPSLIFIIAAFESKDGIEIARCWIGTEGQNLVFLRQIGSRFVPVKEDYRYTAPE